MYEPQGPLPREIYVRRRIAAVVVAVVVLALIFTALYLASRDGGTDTQEVASTTATSTSSTTSASPTTSTSAEESTAAQASRGRCDDEDLSLSLTPAQANVPVDTSVRFYVQIQNTSDTACDRDLSGAPLSFEVYRLDTNSKVWSSIDCTTPKREDKVVLQPGVPVVRQIDWSGRRSAPGECSSASRTPVEVGYYQVYALVGDVFSQAATFNVVTSDG